MRKRLIVGLAAVALGATLTIVTARSRLTPPEPAAVAVADAGAVHAAAPPYDFGPRIIHVPPSGERRARASIADEPELDEGGDEDVPPRRRVAPKPQKRSAAPAEQRRRPFNAGPAPQPRRAVLSAPPDDASLTPIRPTPRFDARPESGEKFSAAPPPGYVPPRALPAPAPRESADSTDDP